MRFTTKTEYGLVCLTYMARYHPEGMITIKEIVKNEQFSSTYIEKILQKLRSSNIVVSHQGKQGGYKLARRPSEITLKEIIDALEGGHTFDIRTFAVYCKPDLRQKIVCTHFSMCGLRPVWEKTKELLDQFYGSVTLDIIAKAEHEVKSLVAVSSSDGEIKDG